jgi:hypothetical protein
MPRNTAKEREEERFVRETLGTRFGVALRKLPESNRKGVKAADFELLVDTRRAAVLEVKRLIRTPRTPANGWTVTDHGNGVREAVREDNSSQRVAKVIQESWTQLSLYAEPKILTIVNDERMADVRDLSEAFNGFLEYGNEKGLSCLNVAASKIANGKIREVKWKIDLYVWIDRAHGKGPVFNVVTEEGLRLARLTFGCPDIGMPPNKALHLLRRRRRPFLC